MQAKLQRRKSSRRRQARAQLAKREWPMMDQPLQNPPVDRQYMRPIACRTDTPAQPTRASRKHTTAPKGEQGQPGGVFIVELKTFHVNRYAARRPRL